VRNTAIKQRMYLLGEVGEGVSVDPVLDERSSLSLSDKLAEPKPVLHALLASRLPLQRALTHQPTQPIGYNN